MGNAWLSRHCALLSSCGHAWLSRDAIGAVTSANTSLHVLSARVHSCSLFLEQAAVLRLVFTFNILLKCINPSAALARHATALAFVVLLLIVSRFWIQLVQQLC